ncbi:MAG TPA: phosphatidylglycerol lysyltransferase domain-containing protein, partial [Acidimicrobiales bacterium]|nr:phosphatidylglycerol lysyltransferase domain-containing protein [Acidimicrobiales bacterium]
VVVVAGNLVDPRDGRGVAGATAAALDAHPRLAGALEAFLAGEDRRVVVIPGEADGALAAEPEALLSRGIEVAPALDLSLATGAGTRRVRVEGRLPGGAVRGATAGALTLAPNPDAPWQEGLERLVDPAGTPRFLTSRLLYRRFARLAWWLLVPFAVALALRLSFVTVALNHLVFGHPAPTRAISRAHEAGWGPRLLSAALVCAAELVILAVVLGWVARKAWRTLGGGDLVPGGPEGLSAGGATANDAVRDRARGACQGGYAGLVSGATLQAELTHLGPGFFACPGPAGEVVEERRGRLGMLPVFASCRQLGWVELETGAELHARLLLARTELPAATLFERMAATGQGAHDAHPVVVAAHPHGGSWPPPPDLGVLRRRSRRVRRWAAAAIAVAGLADLLTAVTPPLRGRLHLVLELLPYGATEAAGALVALTGIGLLALARGVRRGQRRAFVIAVWILGVSLVLHLARGGEVGQSGFALAVLGFLLVSRREFPAESDRPSLRSAVVALVAGVLGITVVTTALLELTLRFDFDRPHMPLWRAGQAVLERLVGLRGVALPDRLDDFLAPALLAVGVALAVLAVVLATRPLVDRRRTAGRAAQTRARDIVRRHGGGTLDYFALRSDKQWFFHRDSLVAYAIYGGVCLVSPDPVGPLSEREQVWGEFRRFADAQGWVVALMGASEQWLPVYRATGMHDIYIGDEAVVDVRAFSLAGGHMKGLRQAHNRVAKYGYTVSFHDPGRLDRRTAERLIPLMAQSRRGEFERGFSMVLGRIFDPRDVGLLLCVVTAPDGAPAALCQFVPAPGIGGYSLDLMRRDRGEHPNGLVDFALVSTIGHLRERGARGLSLNFAALRSVLEGERGDGPAQRVERWALKRMSSFLQIETLWRFNAKYGPEWLPRYVVFDTAEHLVPVVLAILRAESLSEVPVIGRMIAASERRAHAAASAEGGGLGGGESLLPLGAPPGRADGGGDDRAAPEPVQPVEHR